MSVGISKPARPEHIPEHTLWIVRKGDRTAEARVRMVPLGPELRIYYNGAFRGAKSCAMVEMLVTSPRPRKPNGSPAAGWLNESLTAPATGAGDVPAGGPDGHAPGLFSYRRGPPCALLRPDTR